eukprot:COSAG02_NODE_2956_length_7669_cov_10.857860_2_plen_100_part_00
MAVTKNDTRRVIAVEAEVVVAVVATAEQDSDTVAKANEGEGEGAIEGVLQRHSVPRLVELRRSVPPMVVAIADPWTAFWMHGSQRLGATWLLASAIGDS